MDSYILSIHFSLGLRSGCTRGDLRCIYPVAGAQNAQDSYEMHGTISILAVGIITLVGTYQFWAKANDWR